MHFCRHDGKWMLRGLAGIFERRQMSSRKFAHPGRHSASRGPHTELGGGRDGERHAPLGTDTDEVSEHLHSTVRRPHSRAPRVVEGRRSVRGRQLSFGAPRPARRLRRVQQRSAAADLCVSASTQLCGVVAHHLPIRTHGLPSHTHPRALHDLRPASYQTSASASEGVVAKSVYFSFTGSVRRRRRRRAKSKALGRKRAGWLTRSGSQPSTGLWAQAEGDKEGASTRVEGTPPAPSSLGIGACRLDVPGEWEARRAVAWGAIALVNAAGTAPRGDAKGVVALSERDTISEASMSAGGSLCATGRAVAESEKMVATTPFARRSLNLRVTTASVECRQINKNIPSRPHKGPLNEITCYGPYWYYGLPVSGNNLKLRASSTPSVCFAEPGNDDKTNTAARNKYVCAELGTCPQLHLPCSPPDTPGGTSTTI
ncbi:hypothetical protein AK812_SmicGene18957 [Symbiodinium microadriaticum]|uniref:Uncharacterized protein n=1 Tax=Symbiodinium microadriaticum TaxID=2951 RepID=A0A1Q9DTW5_SYMMI|nr:hypothetical protein AK812_SmicGene18957 [Symbiodinium microadriaticum]